MCNLSHQHIVQVELHWHLLCQYKSNKVHYRLHFTNEVYIHCLSFLQVPGDFLPSRVPGDFLPSRLYAIDKTCPDNSSHCPENNTCCLSLLQVPGDFLQVPGDFLPSRLYAIDKTCPDNSSHCPDNNTCCPNTEGHFGCCPIEKVRINYVKATEPEQSYTWCDNAFKRSTSFLRDAI